MEEIKINGSVKDSNNKINIVDCEQRIKGRQPRIGHLCKFWWLEKEPDNIERFNYVIDYLNKITENRYHSHPCSDGFPHCRELTSDDLILAKPKLPRPEIGTPVCCLEEGHKYYTIIGFGLYEDNEKYGKIIFRYAKPIPSLNSMLVEDLINHPEFYEYEV